MIFFIFLYLYNAAYQFSLISRINRVEGYQRIKVIKNLFNAVLAIRMREPLEFRGTPCDFGQGQSCSQSPMKKDANSHNIASFRKVPTFPISLKNIFWTIQEGCPNFFGSSQFSKKHFLIPFLTIPNFPGRLKFSKRNLEFSYLCK